MTKIAILITVFNRKDKTLDCLQSLFLSLGSEMALDIWLTDDGSTDGTADAVRNEYPDKNIHILQGDGTLFWNGGMINSWKAAMRHGGYDGYLWLNNDVKLFQGLFCALNDAESWSMDQYGKKGIYVGTVRDSDGSFSYGGFNFKSKLTLKDEFVIPDSEFHLCECAHGNVTYVSQDVVDKMGIFHDGYIHGGTDHDYTYLAHKAGFPVVVLKDYVGICDNDHQGSQNGMRGKSLKERIAYLKSPMGLNLHNILLFQKRCFPWRLPFAWAMAYAKAICPGLAYRLYRMLRIK